MLDAIIATAELSVVKKNSAKPFFFVNMPDLLPTIPPYLSTVTNTNLQSLLPDGARSLLRREAYEGQHHPSTAVALKYQRKEEQELIYLICQ